MVQFEVILQEIGAFGLYQKLRFFLLCIPAGFGCAFSMYMFLFMSYVPEHHCRLPDISEASTTPTSSIFIPPQLRAILQSNASESELFHQTLPRKNVFGIETWDRCRMFDFKFSVDNSTSDTRKNDSRWLINCPYGWEYGNEFGITIVTQWNLVCDRAFIRHLIMTISDFVSLLGLILFSYLQDCIGRKPTLMLAIVWFNVLGIISIFQQDLLNFTITWALRSMVTWPMYQIPYIMVLEFVDVERRSFVNCFMYICFSVGESLLPLIAWLVRNYVQLVLATTLWTIPYLFLWFVLDESPRWLMTVGKYDEAKRVLRKIALTNGGTFREELLDPHSPDEVVSREAYLDNAAAEYGDVKLVEPVSRVPASPSLCVTVGRSHSLRKSTSKCNEICNKIMSFGFFQLFSRWSLTVKTLIMTYIWLVTLVVFYGLDLNVENLGTNPYVTFAFLGLAEIPAVMFTYPLLDRVGRVWTMGVTTAVAGVASIITVHTPGHQSWLVILMSLVTKLCITSAYLVIYQVAGEVYPTVIRATGVGFINLVSGCISSATPFLIYAASATNDQMLPMMVFGGLTIGGGALCFLLPETAHKPLPDTLDESERVFKTDLHALVSNLSCRILRRRSAKQ